MVDFAKLLAKKLAENAIKNRENKVTEKTLQKAFETAPIVKQVKTALDVGKSIKQGVDAAYNKSEKNVGVKTPIQDAAKARKTSTAQTVNNVLPVSTQTVPSTQRVDINTNATDIQSMIVRIAKEEGVDPALALSIAHVETGGTFNPNAVGDNGNSFGLFQIHKPSHPDYKGGTDPEANIRYGLRLFKGLLDRNGGSVNKAIWAYNAGQGNLNKGILPATTKNYINKVASLAPQYRQSGISEIAPVSQKNREIIQSMAPDNTQGQNRIGNAIQSQQATVNTPPAKPEAVLSTPAQDTLLTQLQSEISDPRNEQISIPTMYNRLMDQYNELYNTIQTQDPRYQGEIVQGQQYYVDPVQLQSRMELDRIAKGVRDARGMTAPQSSKAQDYLNQAQTMYQVAKANEAGVPYADYQAAMLDRQKQMIATRAAQVETQLNMAIQNETNIFRKQQLIQQMEQNKVAAQNAINNLDYQLRYGSYDTTNQAENQIRLQNLRAIQQQEANDLQYNRDLAKLTYQNQLAMQRDAAKPQSQGNLYSGLNAINALAGYDTQKAGKLIQASGMGSQWFPQMTPELAQELWGQPSRNQQQGFFGKLMSGWKNNVGLQANEQ